MTKGTAFALVAISLVVGFAIGRGSGKGGGGGDEESAAVVEASAGDKAIAGDVDRVRTPADSLSRGPNDALVTIVAFSDFQCPFCSRVNPTIEQLVKDYPGKVRVQFRHYPLPFHSDAPLASQASLEAGAQGKFWEMHDKLFTNQRAIKREDLDKYAGELGLDMGKFKAALDSGKHKAQVEADTALGGKLGVRGTPHFFINGRALSGAQPITAFKEIVDDELVRAEKRVKAGTPKSQVYAKLMATARAADAPAPAAAGDAPAAPAQPSADQVYKVPLGNSPVQGGKAPKVTIVAFSEFQCPFCSRVLPTLKQVHDTYGEDVAVVFKHLPLPFHDNAKGAARAAVAAGLQGKFWEMHDKMFANQQTLGRENLDTYAKEIGLNMAKFAKDLDSTAVNDQIAADEALAGKVGARGTPTFFVNGVIFRGAQPFESFKATIDAQLKKADEKLKAGVVRKNLYAEFIKNGAESAAAAAPAAPSGGAAAPEGAPVKVPVSASDPQKGPNDALVTIVEFSDFQCPFCSRVMDTMKQIHETYKGKVRVVWKDLPLSFHQNAKPAAIAARAAHEQGKFWEMHDKLFANQQQLDRPTYERYAQELGLNAGKFKAALDADKTRQLVEDAERVAGQVGATGTPAFYINGVKLSGAQPFAAFQAAIDVAMKKAEELVAKGTPKAKVYEELMKLAGTAAAAPAAAAGEPPGPEADKTVFTVTPGNSPSRGPKNAAITMVVFSEFQCPFCSRIKPTIDQIESEYKGKVRVVFKHYPLPFHENAKPASMAAMAAGEQGKFWEMHDKLFANQQQLDRASLDKYAQEIGLDMGKFKSAMDSGKFAAQLAADMKEAEAVGVNGTPATFINGRKIGGAYPYPTFKAIVDQELAKKKG